MLHSVLLVKPSLSQHILVSTHPIFCNGFHSHLATFIMWFHLGRSLTMGTRHAHLYCFLHVLRLAENCFTTLHRLSLGDKMSVADIDDALDYAVSSHFKFALNCSKVRSSYLKDFFIFFLNADKGVVSYMQKH